MNAALQPTNTPLWGCGGPAVPWWSLTRLVVSDPPGYQLVGGRHDTRVVVGESDGMKRPRSGLMQQCVESIIHSVPESRGESSTFSSRLFPVTYRRSVCDVSRRRRYVGCL